MILIASFCVYFGGICLRDLRDLLGILIGNIWFHLMNVVSLEPFYPPPFGLFHYQVCFFIAFFTIECVYPKVCVAAVFSVMYL